MGPRVRIRLAPAKSLQTISSSASLAPPQCLRLGAAHGRDNGMVKRKYALGISGAEFPVFRHTLKKSSQIELLKSYILSYNPRLLVKSLPDLDAAPSRLRMPQALDFGGSTSISGMQCSCSSVESRDRACVSEPPTRWKRTGLYPLPTSGQP